MVFVISEGVHWNVGWKRVFCINSDIVNVSYRETVNINVRVTNETRHVHYMQQKKTMDLYLKNDLGQNWTCSVVHMPNMSLLLSPREKIGGSQTNGAKIEVRQGGRRAASARSRWPSRPDAAENPAKQIMSRLDYLGDPDYSGASSSGSAPGCLCRDQLFSLSFLPGLSCLSPAPDQPERRRRRWRHACKHCSPCDGIT